MDNQVPISTFVEDITRSVNIFRENIKHLGGKYLEPKQIDLWYEWFLKWMELDGVVVDLPNPKKL